MNHDVIYYECHINLEPMEEGKRRELATKLASIYEFRMAKLLMAKGEAAADAFLTGRDTSYNDLYERMNQLHSKLLLAEFRVRRTKIEAVIYDVLYDVDAPSRKL